MRQLYRIGNAGRLPSVSGTVYADHETNDYAGEEPSRDPELGAKATVSWELDLWETCAGPNAKAVPNTSHRSRTGVRCR